MKSNKSDFMLWNCICGSFKLFPQQFKNWFLAIFEIAFLIFLAHCASDGFEYLKLGFRKIRGVLIMGRKKEIWSRIFFIFLPIFSVFDDFPEALLLWNFEKIFQYDKNSAQKMKKILVHFALSRIEFGYHYPNLHHWFIFSHWAEIWKKCNLLQVNTLLPYLQRSSRVPVTVLQVLTWVLPIQVVPDNNRVVQVIKNRLARALWSILADLLHPDHDHICTSMFDT